MTGFYIKSLQVTLDTAQKIEETTRQQSDISEWQMHHKPRMTFPRLQEACYVRGLSSAKNVAEGIIRGMASTAEMMSGPETEREAMITFARITNINLRGLVIHADVPWLASSPDGKVSDPLEHPPFGLVEFIFFNVSSFVDCKYIHKKDGSPALYCICSLPTTRKLPCTSVPKRCRNIPHLNFLSHPSS